MHKCQYSFNELYSKNITYYFDVEERYIQVDTGGEACKVLPRNILGETAVKSPEKIKSRSTSEPNFLNWALK
jgi:hypothetical protein